MPNKPHAIHDISGHTLTLRHPSGRLLDTAWYVDSIGSGIVRVHHTRSMERSVIEWSLLRAYINDGRIQVEY